MMNLFGEQHGCCGLPTTPFWIGKRNYKHRHSPKLTSRILRSFGEFGVNAIIKVVVDTANNVDVIINVNINTIVIISNAAIVNINDIFAVNDNDNNPVLVINLHV